LIYLPAVLLPFAMPSLSVLHATWKLAAARLRLIL
jgi:hypothetical protein